MSSRRWTGTAGAGAIVAALLALGAAQLAHGTRRSSDRDQRGGAAVTLTGASARIARGRQATIPSGDWTTFDYDAQRSGDGPADTGITAANLHRLETRTVSLPGTVDSSAVELHGLTVDGRTRDVAFMTTSYGITFALDVGTGQLLWKYVPAGTSSLVGSPQITAATPVIDPDGEFVYATSPNGFVHKLQVTSGRLIWSTQVLYNAVRQKLPSSLNISGDSLIVVTDGYDGDTPPYQGHVVLVNLASGRISAVFNALCSNRHELIDPSNCVASDAGIWGRSGSVVEPDGDILVATGNAPFNGSTEWGDSVLELSPTLSLLHNWTPTYQQELNVNDLDLGSTEPALLPAIGNLRLAVQGGKAAVLDLLDLDRLDGTTGPAGPRTGGQLQQVRAPGDTDVFTAPAVWSDGGRVYVFVATNNGTAAFSLTAAHRLSVVWQDATPGTSPVVAGGLLYVYDPVGGTLEVRNPVTGSQLANLAAAPGHWNSPIVVGGRIILPVGDDNDHLSTGRLFIYHLPGR
jgi:outer membrane protein assembly factor BamB